MRGKTVLLVILGGVLSTSLGCGDDDKKDVDGAPPLGVDASSVAQDGPVDSSRTIDAGTSSGGDRGGQDGALGDRVVQGDAGQGNDIRQAMPDGSSGDAKGVGLAADAGGSDSTPGSAPADASMTGNPMTQPANRRFPDFNGDGKNDIALLNVPGEGFVPIALGGGMAFTVVSSNASGFSELAADPSVAVVTGDFSGDGLTDIAVVGAKGVSGIPVALARPDGNFDVVTRTVSASLALATLASYRLSGDVDGDGKSDLLLLSSPGRPNMRVAFSNGDGSFTESTFTFPADFDALVESRSVPLVGDFDGDGKVDIAVTGGTLTDVIAVAYSDGRAGFSIARAPAAAFASVVSQAVTRFVGDLDGDGRSDLVALDIDGVSTIPVALSRGRGMFQVSATGYPEFTAQANRFATNATPLIGDFNGDKKADIALAGGLGWNGIPVALSKGDGTFTIMTSASAEFGALAAQRTVSRLAGDFDGDGVTDIALVGGSGWTTIPVAFGSNAGEFIFSNIEARAFAEWGAKATWRLPSSP